jgi:hypothetical protein
MSTLVPDRELSCDYWNDINCKDGPIYRTDHDFAEMSVSDPAQKKFLWGKARRKMYGVKWPCCETFDDDNGIWWRMGRHIDAPRAFMCWVIKDQKGLK